MAENSKSESSSPARRRRRWPFVIGIVVLLIIILILLIPTIASTPLVRGYVLGKINANLNGKLTIKNWSLGWTSGASASGVTLRGKNGQVLSLDHVATGLTLPNAISGNYDLGNVTISGLHFSLKLDKDGRSNLQEVFQQAAQTAENSRQKTSAPAANSPLPNVSGNITLTNITGTISSPGSPVVDVDLHGTVKIPNINQPIDDDLTMTLKSGDLPPGTIVLNGKIAAIQDNKIVEQSKMTIDQTLVLKSIDLKNISPLLAGGSITSVGGVANGQLAVSMSPGKTGSIQGQLQAADVFATGPVFQGDRFSTKVLEIQIPKTELAAAPQAIHTSSPIRLTIDQGTLSLAANTPVEALQNFRANRAPGSAGAIDTNLRVNFAALSNELPHLLNLRPGLQLSSGNLLASAKINFSADKTSIAQHAELSDITGIQANPGDTGKISLDPISLDASTIVLPGKHKMPRLHDLSIKFASGFATADFHGPSIANFAGQAHADLAQAQQQLGQIFDLSGHQLRGTMDANLTCRGNVARTGTPIVLTSKITVRDLEIAGGDRPIHEQLATLSANGKILRDTTNSITGIDDLSAELQAGNASDPAVNLAAAASVRFTGDKIEVPSFKIPKSLIDLPQLQQQYGALPGVPAGVKISSGSLSAALAGSCDGTTMKLETCTLAASNLTASRTETGGEISLLKNYSTRMELAGTIVNQPSDFSATLFRFSIDDNHQLFSVTKSGDSNVVISIPIDGRAQATGRFELFANLAPLNQLIAALGTNPNQSSGLTSGTLTGTADLSTTNQGIALQANVKAADLSMPSAAQPIEHENLSLAITASASGALSNAKISKLDFQSSFLSANGSLDLRLNQIGLEMLQSAALTVKVPDVPRTGILLAAVSRSAQPVVWDAGNALAKINATRTNGTLHADASISASDLGFTRAAAQYHFDPIHLKAAADLSGDNLDLQALDGSLGSIANVQLIQPIHLKNQSSLSAAGEIRLTGDLARLDELLSAWNGQASKQKLAGQFTMDQKFSTTGSVVTAAGGIKLNDLAVAVDPHNTFREQSLALANNVTFDSASQTLQLRDCSISMQSSHALDAVLTGTIRNLSTNRDFENLRADISYDLSKLIPLASPMLSPDTQKTLAEYKITGNQKHTITITGSFPANQDFNKSVPHLSATGSIGLDSLTGNGITLTNLAPDFNLRNGVFSITGNQSADRSPPTFNGGVITLTGISCDLSDPAQPISAPPNLQLVRGANLNAQLLGSFGSDLTPLLSHPNQAAGALDVTLVHCRGLSLAQFGASTASNPSGSAEVIFSVRNVQIANDMAVALAAVAPGAISGNSLVGNIRNGQISVQNGIVSSNVTLFLGNNLPLNFAGSINLQTRQLNNFVINLPSSLIPDVRNNPQIAQYVPNQIPIAVNGTTDHYQLDVADSVTRLVREALKKGAVQGVLGAITGQNQNQPNNGTKQNQGENNGLNNLLNNVLGGGGGGDQNNGESRHRQRH